jgi:hypothetical protein
MTMSPVVRTAALLIHVSASVGWVGALAVFLVHSVVAVWTDDPQTVRALSIAMGATAWLVILPLSIASLITGLVQALGTAWGLVRHYWVVFKLVLTCVATGVLLLKLGPISELARAARESAFASGDLMGLRTSLLVHAAAGLVVLLLIAGLAVFKPSGLTRHGQRANGLRPAAAPRWVKWSGVAVVVLALALIGMMLGGGHGPAAHLP